ncbi:MAG: hypothetical protein J2P17_27865 [Mycobacterium sp.]|nr:hypothetical protein [Mycobacterium sp.]
MSRRNDGVFSAQPAGYRTFTWICQTIPRRRHYPGMPAYRSHDDKVTLALLTVITRWG